MEGEKVIIVNPEEFQRKKKIIVDGGVNNLQIVTDFDRTLTSAVVNGKPGASSYGVIEHSGLLSEEYHIKIREYFTKYSAIEEDPEMPIHLKIPFIVEWYQKANQQLVKEKIPLKLFDEMISKANLAFREGVHSFLESTSKNSVPVLVFSAGIGDLIERIFVHFEGRLHQNVHVVSNRVQTDENGIIVDFKEPLIHVFNKNEMALSHRSTASWFESVSHRKNMILLGDSPGDVGMACGLGDAGAILKIGFLNTVHPTTLQTYKTLFDVIILNDGSFEFPLGLLEEIAKGSSPIPF
uniref:5'-nucleotidase n=1 Tax=Arcella intermedia TaxID=1963864 RepID=A0A6B2LC94_9EUKA